MASAAAERTSFLAGIPQSADEYALDLPEGFEMPEGADGAEFKIDPESNIAQSVKTWAHEHGVPQSAVTALLGVYAKDVVSSASAEVAAAREELGARADERLGAVENWLKAQGLSEAEYDAMANVATSAASIAAMEKIMARMQSRMSGAKPEGDAIDIPTSLDEVRELKNSPEYRPGSDAERRVKAFYAKQFPGAIRANA